MGASFPNRLQMGTAIAVTDFKEAGELLLELVRSNTAWRGFAPRNDWGKQIDKTARGKETVEGLPYHGSIKNLSVELVKVTTFDGSVHIKAIIRGEMVPSCGYIGNVTVEWKMLAHTSQPVCERIEGAEAVQTYHDKACRRGRRIAEGRARLPALNIGAVGLGKDR